MPVDAEGVFTKRGSEEILNDLIDALRAKFSTNVDVTPAGTFFKVLTAAVVLPMAEVEADMDDLYSQMFFDSATSINLDKMLEPFGFTRDPATRAEGEVIVSMDDGLTAPPEADPFFPNGSLTFADTAGKKYDQIADASLEGKVFSSVQTGTASETIDGTTTRIAQKFILATDKTVGHFAVKATGTITLTASIQTDTAGSPSGTLAHDDLELTGFIPTTGVLTKGHFGRSRKLVAGTYWLVLERTAGSATFDGGTGSTADQVKKYAGSWALSATVENLLCDIYGDLIVSVRAQDFGSLLNIEEGGIVDVEFANSTVSSRWSTNVDEFHNDEEFAGGQDAETDRALRQRVRDSNSSRESASLDGLVEMALGIDGVTSVTGIENTTDTGGQEDKPFDSDETGVASTTVLDGAGDKIAQKMVLTERRFVQHFNAKLFADTALIATVRIETDSAGDPSGSLANDAFELTGFDFDGTNLSTGSFEDGAYLSAGTYWLVFEWESGSGTFDGNTGGTADQVKGDTGGGWTLDATVENLNLEAVGGVPPHGFRLYIDGGETQEIGEAIWNRKAAGIQSDGTTQVTVEDLSGTNQLVYFERPAIVNVVISVTVTKTDEFTGDANTIRDILVDYIGGTNTQNEVKTGLGVREKLVRQEAMGRLMESDVIAGIEDVTLFRLGRKDDFPTPGDLTAAEVVNLTAALNEKFRIDDPATDIDVVLVDA